MAGPLTCPGRLGAGWWARSRPCTARRTCSSASLPTPAGRPRGSGRGGCPAAVPPRDRAAPRCSAPMRRRSLPGAVGVLREGGQVGVYCICLDADERLLPAECHAVVAAGPDGLLAVQQMNSPAIGPVRQHHLVRMGPGLLPSPPARAHLDERPGIQLRRHPGRRHPRWPGRQPSRRPADTMDHADRPGTQLTRPAARAATDTPRPAIARGTGHRSPAGPTPTRPDPRHQAPCLPEPNPRTH